MTRLMVVDDEDNVLDALKLILSGIGYEVSAHNSGHSALEALQARTADKPDLVIADIVMPHMTGIQLYQSVRGSVDAKAIPFLFLSALISPEIETLVASNPNTAYMGKPFVVEDLLEKIDAMCLLR